MASIIACGLVSILGYEVYRSLHRTTPGPAASRTSLPRCPRSTQETNQHQNQMNVQAFDTQTSNPTGRTWVVRSMAAGI